MELAIRRGVPTALFGQGLGPIAHPELWQRASDVLPLVTLIGVRESRASVPLLSSLGVNPANIAVTGDDAVELAFSALGGRAKPASEASTIGVNVRVAAYAEIESNMLSVLREALAAAARAHDARHDRRFRLRTTGAEWTSPRCEDCWRVWATPMGALRSTHRSS